MSSTGLYTPWEVGCLQYDPRIDAATPRAKLDDKFRVDEARAADDDDLHVRPLPLSSSQHDVVPHGQRWWEIGFAQHLSKFDLDKATDLGDRHVVRRSFERVLRALADLVEGHVHPGHQDTAGNREPRHLAGEESRNAGVRSIELVDDAERQQGGEAPDEDRIDPRVLSRNGKFLNRSALLC